MLSFNEKYSALQRKDSAYEGIFFAAITSTMIFCRPTCTARKPKAENVVFYDTAKEALQNGFRPCKICKPMEPLGNIPDNIRIILKNTITLI